MSLTTSEFEKTVTRLGEALAAEKNEFVRDSVIQRFEFCIELAWKTAKKVMGSSSTAPKTVVREMAQNNLIDDVELWLKAIDMRNLSSHTYKEKLAEEVYNFVGEFFPQLEGLVGKLKSQ